MHFLGNHIPDPSVQGFTEAGFHALCSAFTFLPPTGTTWYSALVLPKPVIKERQIHFMPMIPELLENNG